MRDRGTNRIDGWTGDCEIVTVRSMCERVACVSIFPFLSVQEIVNEYACVHLCVSL